MYPASCSVLCCTLWHRPRAFTDVSSEIAQDEIAIGFV